MRTSIWLDALEGHARIALVAPRGAGVRSNATFEFFPANVRISSALAAALRVVLQHLPLQTLTTARFDWAAAIAAAYREVGSFDATVIILSRAEPWARASIQGGARILDAIDSLRLSAAERANAATPGLRWLWRHEEGRLARAEKEVGRAYDSVVVVNEEERREFGGSATAIANSVAIQELDERAPRPIDFAFWGRLPYFANADAALWFLNDIVPRLRTLVPNATIAIGGAEASRSLRKAAERAGIALFSPLPDVSRFARSVRVAIIPMRFGSGQSSKILEAAEGGCAIVTTHQALRGLPRLAPHVRTGEHAADIAAEAVALLTDETRRVAMVSELRAAVEQHHGRKQILAAMRALVGIEESVAASRA